MELGPAPRKHAPPQAVYPRHSWGSGGIIALSGQFRAGFSEQFIILARKDEPTRTRKLGKGALDYLQSHPFCKKATLGS